MELLNIKINGVEVQAPAGSTIIEAAHYAGIDIPSLCYLKGINEIGACRMCVCEVKGSRALVAACVYPINEGMEVFTNSPKVVASRKLTMELILSNHRMECLTCSRSGDCELQRLAKDLGVETVRFQTEKPEPQIEASAAHLVRDNSKCILCRRCVGACQNQGIGVIGANNRGFKTEIGCAFERDLNETACVSCGQCIVACPTGALEEKDDTARVWEAIRDPQKHVVVGTAPAVRATLGECFDMPIGTNVEGKMVAALRRMGFDGVFDVNTAADFTIIEEGNELLERIKNGGVTPMITSCSPGWIRYAEQYYPDFLDNLSTCKSPQQMFGALCKTYYADKLGLDPQDIVVVTVMPCTAKKYEVLRPDMQAAKGVNDVDISITTRELAKMIRSMGLRFTALPDEDFDPMLGISTGAATIFGASGGVMEAALRTVASLMLGGDDAAPLEFHDVRGMENCKEATYELPGKTVRVAVVSGTKNAGMLLDAVKAGEKEYDFIEVMCCPGGCINGGGQPHQSSEVRSFTDLKALRAKALYDEDAAKELRRSHLNPVVQEVYADYLGAWGGEKAHHILHTKYHAQPKYRL